MIPTGPVDSVSLRPAVNQTKNPHSLSFKGNPLFSWRSLFPRTIEPRQSLMVVDRYPLSDRIYRQLYLLGYFFEDKAVTILDNRSLILEEIAKKVELPVDALREWITIYNHQGLAGLNRPRKKRSPGKKGVALERKRVRVLGLIHSRPQAYGINRASWNHASLATAYKQCYEETISKATDGRILQKAGYKIKKARRVLSSPDPEYREKVDLVLTTLRNLQPNELFFFIDELGPLRVKKYGGRGIVHERDVHPGLKPDRSERQNIRSTLYIYTSLSDRSGRN